MSSSWYGSLRLAYGMRLRFVGAFVFFGGMFYLPLEALRAAPLVFQFAATISEIHGDASALNLPFSLAVGQHLHGSVEIQIEPTFRELLSELTVSEQSTIPLIQSAIRISVEGNDLEAAVNFMGINQSGPVDITNPILPVAGSSISLYYHPLTDVFPGWGGVVEDNYWNAGLWVGGSKGVISTGSDVLDANTWSQLASRRHLGLQFGRFVSGEFTVATVNATIGDFLSVPEPRSSWVTSVLLAWIYLGFTSVRGAEYGTR